MAALAEDEFAKRLLELAAANDASASNAAADRSGAADSPQGDLEADLKDLLVALRRETPAGGDAAPQGRAATGAEAMPSEALLADGDAELDRLGGDLLAALRKEKPVASSEGRKPAPAAAAAAEGEDDFTAKLLRLAAENDKASGTDASVDVCAGGAVHAAARVEVTALTAGRSTAPLHDDDLGKLGADLCAALDKEAAEGGSAGGRSNTIAATPPDAALGQLSAKLFAALSADEQLRPAASSCPAGEAGGYSSAAPVAASRIEDADMSALGASLLAAMKKDGGLKAAPQGET
eukprot:TRINITY_DN48632_c0_g1_i1.p1 TRINITY_DN48632_c0_g1~~TRINITY_DN48632_c0_g1_i1.p1  ORF type:complete len:293 (+),score=82.13 TRINITY_DN48632_c0_g1_i1:56-934(+)